MNEYQKINVNQQKRILYPLDIKNSIILNSDKYEAFVKETAQGLQADVPSGFLMILKKDVIHIIEVSFSEYYLNELIQIFYNEKCENVHNLSEKHYLISTFVKASFYHDELLLISLKQTNLN